MRQLRRAVDIALVVSVMVLCTRPAQAQSVLRWQLQPYCNVVTLNVVAQGTVFTLDGFDDQCGAGQRASVVGTAFLNPDGTAGIGLTTVLAPGGAFVHIDARIGLATLNGPWRDSAGNDGTFVLTPGTGTGGPVRPVAPNGIAPASITNVQLATNSITTNNIVNGGVTTADLAAPAHAAFVGADQAIDLPSLATVIRTVTLSIPAPGRVIVNASGYYFLDSVGQDTGKCSITTGTGLESIQMAGDDFGVPASRAFVPFAGTRGFDVTAGTFTVRLVCLAEAGTVRLRDSSLTAIYVAN